MNEEVVIGKDGVYKSVKTRMHVGWEKCQTIEDITDTAKDPVDSDIKAGLTWIANKCPASEFTKVLGTIREFPNRETGYILYYRSKDRSWKISCPPQKGSGMRVDFDDNMDLFKQGYSQIGSIHTHPEMKGDWSGVDLNDQKGLYGIHVVLGLHKGIPTTWRCTDFTRLGAYDQDLWRVFEKVDMLGDHKPVKEWVATIKKGDTIDRAQIKKEAAQLATAKAPLSFEEWCKRNKENDDAKKEFSVKPFSLFDDYRTSGGFNQQYTQRTSVRENWLANKLQEAGRLIKRVLLTAMCAPKVGWKEQAQRDEELRKLGKLAVEIDRDVEYYHEVQSQRHPFDPELDDVEDDTEEELNELVDACSQVGSTLYAVNTRLDEIRKKVEKLKGSSRVMNDLEQIEDAVSSCISEIENQGILIDTDGELEDYI